MKYSVLAGVVLLTICSFGDLTGQTASPATQSRDVDEIVRLLRQWTDAMTVGDAQALDQLLADNFTFVSPRGRLILRAMYVANRDTSRGAVFATESARFDDVLVRFYDGFSVSTSRYTTTTQTNDAGFLRQQTSGEYTRTDTWIKVDGRWRALATQLTPIGYAGAHAVTESAALHGVSSGDLKWAESPMYPGAQVAVLHGQPYAGGFAVRMKRPARHFERAHRHESDEHVSVLSGTLHVGVGDGSNRAIARTFRAGGYVVIPSGTLHYSWADGDVLEEIHWDGPAAPVYASERTEIALPRATLASYTGTYRFDDGATLTITVEGGQLTGRLSGAPASFPIFAESETRFFLKSAPPGSSVGVNQAIEFVKDASGVVTDLRLGNRRATRVSR
jgi:quercetin dioxygenase-like cupin family protein